MNKPTLLFISMGELATHLLEAVARTEIFGTIVVASRNLEKAKKRTNNAVLGAGIEGFFPRIIAEKLDIHSNDFSTRLREIKPDFIFSAPSLLPWWKLAPDGINMPFAGYTALHLSLMQKFRNRISESSVKSIWIGASFPDVKRHAEPNRIWSRLRYWKCSRTNCKNSNGRRSRTQLFTEGC